MMGAWIVAVFALSLVYMLLGGIVVDEIYFSRRRLSPIYKPFVIFLWPIALLIVIVIAVYDKTIDWITEVKDWYAKDMED